MAETFWKIIRFGITGISGMAIDFAITWICRDILKWNKYIANTIGLTVAVTSNFILNRTWTFESANPNWQAEFGRFLLFSLTGLVLNNLFIFIFNGRLKMNFYVAKLIATAFVFLWNFTANFFFNFK